MGTPTTRERFIGCMIGLALGDALGSPFEGLTSETIFRDFGSTRKILQNPPDELTYTDDTQMMIGVAESLLADGRIIPDHLAVLFGENYQPGRGYGPGGRRVLDAMLLGQDWRRIVETMFPGGSFGNGAAMRVAPVGLLFQHDLVRLRDESRKSAEVTHLHPLGIEGANLMAHAVAILACGEAFDRKSFFDELHTSAQTDEFQWQLRTAGRLASDDAISFGSSLAAHRSVTSAIACFASWPDSYENAVSRAIALGDDTDTLAAMAGALSGTYLGINAIPPRLISRLENGPKGAGYIRELAEKLHDLWITNNPKTGSS